MLDGVYAADDDGHPQFQALPAPEDQEIEQLAAALAERISKFLLRRGLGPDTDPEEADPLSRDQPWLARLYAASVSGRVAFGPNAGRRTTFPSNPSLIYSSRAVENVTAGLRRSCSEPFYPALIHQLRA